jgi:ABC-type polysaccharide/polyol phosphate transport system ATPase subunit
VAAPIIEAQGLSKQFLLRHNSAESLKARLLGLFHERQRETVEAFWALRDVSFTIRRGESVGLIGRNGSGKTTLLKLIAGIHQPTSGRLLVAREARIGTMIELGLGFHPELTGRENVFLNASIHGLSRAETEAIYDQIVAYSELEHFMDVALKNYSSGMNMRLGFAISATFSPDILLLDEIFAVGDEDFQAKCTQTMRRFVDEGRTIIFVSHAASAVRAICRRVCLLDRGRLLFEGPVGEGIDCYHQLLAAPVDAPIGGAAASGQPEDSPAVWIPDTGNWQLDLLRHEGLQPTHRVLEIGFGPGNGSLPLASFLGDERYRYWQIGTPDPDGSEPFDYAVASSIFLRLPLNGVVRAIATATRRLAPGGRFYATWFDAPSRSFESIERPGGLATYPDAEPYQYSFDILSAMFAALGAEAHRVPAIAPMDGQSVLVAMRREGRSTP